MNGEKLIEFTKRNNKTHQEDTPFPGNIENLKRFTTQDTYKKEKENPYNLGEYIELSSTDDKGIKLQKFLQKPMCLERNKNYNIELYIQDSKKQSAKNKSEKNKIKKRFTEEDLKNMTPDKMAEIILKENNIIVIDAQIYVYNEDIGIYSHLNPEQADLFVREKIEVSLRSKVTSNRVKEMIKWMKGPIAPKIDQKEIDEKSKHYIVFENCTYDLIYHEIIDHSPEHYALSYIHADYPLYGQDCPLFMKIIWEDMAQGDERFVYRLQEIFGAILSNDRTFKKIMFFWGVGNSGKSLLLTILKLLLGAEFVSSLSLKQIGDRFGASGLYGKRANICGESSELNYRSIELLKTLSGNDLVAAEFKGENHFFFENKAILVFAANEPIKIKGGSADPAFLGRLLPLKFKNSIPEARQDKDLINKLQSELGAISAWAIEGYIRLVQNHYVFTETDSDIDCIDDENDTLREFAEEYLVMDENERTPTLNIINAYREYCLDNQISILSEDKIHTYLKNELGLKNTRFQIDGVQARGYIGIKLVN